MRSILQAEARNTFTWSAASASSSSWRRASIFRSSPPVKVILGCRCALTSDESSTRDALVCACCFVLLCAGRREQMLANRRWNQHPTWFVRTPHRGGLHTGFRALHHTLVAKVSPKPPMVHNQSKASPTRNAVVLCVFFPSSWRQSLRSRRDLRYTYYHLAESVFFCPTRTNPGSHRRG